MDLPALRLYLDGVVERYETPDFIGDDPISFPHGFDDPADQEIIGLFAALLAWGRRDTLLRKMEDLAERMLYRPHRFVVDYDGAADAARLDGFGHRTFVPGDVHQLVRALQWVLARFGSLHRAVADGSDTTDENIGPRIERLSTLLLEGPPGIPARMRKHLAKPSTGSACKRLSMYFRWMVRPGPVDLGIWHAIEPRQLVLPLDIHSGRQARAVGLLTRKANDWRAVLELTEACRSLNPEDPARYDFAFFGSGSAGESLLPAR